MPSTKPNNQRSGNIGNIVEINLQAVLQLRHTTYLLQILYVEKALEFNFQVFVIKSKNLGNNI